MTLRLHAPVEPARHPMRRAQAMLRTQRRLLVQEADALRAELDRYSRLRLEGEQRIRTIKRHLAEIDQAILVLKGRA